MLKNSDPALYESFLAARRRHQRGDLTGAEAIYSRLLAMDPADDELLFFFGHLKASQGESEVSLECLRMAEQLKPGNPQIPFAIGLVLQEADRTAESIISYQRAVALDPDFRIAWENLCAACYDIDDFHAGLVAARKALELDAESPLAIRGAANCLTALGQRSAALALLDDGVKLHPALPELRIHRAWELMANGRFAEAWPELEWRHSRKGRRDLPPRFVPYPRWNGEDLVGKIILVYGEQGIGDEIMYAPFVHGIVEAGATCILECDRRLERLFARAFPKCIILRRENREQIPWHGNLPKVDYCVPTLSLPMYFQPPLEGRAFLLADSGRKQYWRDRLGAKGSGLKVGVSWRGGADAKARKIRSIPESFFGELIDEHSIFVSLQYGATPADANRVSPDLLHFPEVDPLSDLDEFVALLSALDVVISIDNSTVHFAGALGVRTLLLLPVYSEWRWGGAKSGVSPWYRSVEFVRQAEASDVGWRELIVQARFWLSSFDGNERGEPSPAASMRAESADIICLEHEIGRSALLVADTSYWYHWGCSCTSLGLHASLQLRYETIRVLPLPRLLSRCPTPTGVDSLDSDEFFVQFSQMCPDILAALMATDHVVINGEGSIHDSSPLALLLLYIAYVAKRRLGKTVAIVNHSCFPGEAPAVLEYYARVYDSLDQALVRESLSLANVRSFGGSASLGFDCLPLFLAKHGEGLTQIRARKLTVAGSVSWSQEMVDSFAELAGWAAVEGFSVEILSGAKAFLASDEVGFVERMVRALETRNVAHMLTFPLSERAWCEAIGRAAILVSGRFHYSVAAAFLQVPFLVAESNTPKIAGLLAELQLDPGIVRLDQRDYALIVEKAERILSMGVDALVSSERLDELRTRAKDSFALL